MKKTRGGGGQNTLESIGGSSSRERAEGRCGEKRTPTPQGDL